MNFGCAFPIRVRACLANETIPPTVDVEKIPGGFKVLDANQQSLAYVYSRENERDAEIANVLTEDEARRVASNIARLPTLLSRR